MFLSTNHLFLYYTLWHGFLTMSHVHVDRTWPSPTMEPPSWSCWKWSTQLPRSCVNWLTCRTRRSEMGPPLWWVGSTAAPTWCQTLACLFCCQCNKLKSECPVLVPCICILLRMCGYANRREKQSVSVWGGRAASSLPPLMKQWYKFFHDDAKYSLDQM